MTRQELIDLIDLKLKINFDREPSEASQLDVFKASALAIRQIMSMSRVAHHNDDDKKREVHYLSMEFLIGRSLEKNAFNLGILDTLTEALEEMGFNAAEIFEEESDAALGNGGLGRLAACYLESLTTQNLPATGYSICYELGIFRQKIVGGEQVELADNWMERGESWLMPKIDEMAEVRFGGTVKDGWDDNGNHYVDHTGYTSVLAVPMDMLIAGHNTDRVNKLRLWNARSPESLDLSLFSKGDYMKAMENRAMAEVITKVLYPEDNHREGKSLRLKQQYFFVSATVQSIVKNHIKKYGAVNNLHEHQVIQINDTHPALVIPELMRILMDEQNLGWDEAWSIVTKTVAYTNHTVLAEALERWPQDLVETLLPRIWDILREINNRYCRDLAAAFDGNQEKIMKMAIIWGYEVRMANLCVATCFAVNGVSALHSEILKNDIFHDTYVLHPEKFKNITNGIDHRRWLAQANPGLNKLVIELLGSDRYYDHAQELEGLEKYKDNKTVLKRLGKVKRDNKLRLVEYVKKNQGIQLNIDAIFDVQVKRLHEYKRQLLNVMHIFYLYNKLRDNPNMDFLPRTFIFGAKAAPGYTVAKQIIRLINSLSKQIMNDPICKGKLQMVFLENYRVSMAEVLIPASEVSEQISTAGKEASGTGNMKFMMNGALTIGTLDGANVEMHEQLGDENIFLFGLKADEVTRLKENGYNPAEYYNRNPDLRRILDHISNGFDDGIGYSSLVSSLLFGNGGEADQYMLLADFEDYCRAHQRLAETYPDTSKWNQMSLINIARSGIFAADRSIQEYDSNIWNAKNY